MYGSNNYCFYCHKIPCTPNNFSFFNYSEMTTAGSFLYCYCWWYTVYMLTITYIAEQKYNTTISMHSNRILSGNMLPQLYIPTAQCSHKLSDNSVVGPYILLCTHYRELLGSVNKYLFPSSFTFNHCHLLTDLRLKQ